MDSKRLMFVVVAGLFFFGLAISLIAVGQSDDWWGFVLNLGTELIGAAAVYFLFDQLIEQPRKRAEEREAERRKLEDEKTKLIEGMGSSVRDVAIAAAGKLKLRGWLEDGSLKKAYLHKANLTGAILPWAILNGANLNRARLDGAKLPGAKLRGASLGRANLTKADLSDANLRGAFLAGAILTGASLVNSILYGSQLWGADLEGADLSDAKLNHQTVLPNGDNYTSETELARFTDPVHPDFWRSKDPYSPAYEGEPRPI